MKQINTKHIIVNFADVNEYWSVFVESCEDDPGACVHQHQHPHIHQLTHTQRPKLALDIIVGIMKTVGRQKNQRYTIKIIVRISFSYIEEDEEESGDCYCTAENGCINLGGVNTLSLFVVHTAQVVSACIRTKISQKIEKSELTYHADIYIGEIRPKNCCDE